MIKRTTKDAFAQRLVRERHKGIRVEESSCVSPDYNGISMINSVPSPGAEMQLKLPPCFSTTIE